MNAKCKCNNCSQLIEFPSEMAGQKVECPSCKMETILFVPPGQIETFASAMPLRETNQIVNCPCQHCNVNIEFDASDLVEENSLVQCPSCGLETKLFIQESKSGDQLPQSVLELIRNGKKIAAIKELHSVVPGLLLSKAKQIVEEAEANSVTAAAEMLRQYKADLGATFEARQAEVDTIMKQIEEMANSMTIFSNLDTLKLLDDTITITKRGLANALASGMNGARTIQISTLTAVQMKPAGLMTPGYILFSYAGSKPFMGGILEATQDPDAFLFGRDLNGQMAEFKAKVEKKMRELKTVTPQNASSGTLTDELRRLAEFKQQGILSQAEFDAAKKKLLA